MTRLVDSFLPALLDPDLPVPEGLTDGQGRSAPRRFAVYRNNVTVSLTEALEAGFPCIAKLLGKDNFTGLARMFLRQSPPSSPLMMHYGAGFPAFLASIPALARFPYLPDVARLELALRDSYHAADSTPIAPARLHAIAPEGLMGTLFTLAPALRLLRSDWPIHDIWRFNMVGGAPQPDWRAQDVVITRPAFDPEMESLPEGAAAFIAALQADTALGQAADTAEQSAPDFDLSRTLALLIAQNAIIDLKEPT